MKKEDLNDAFFQILQVAVGNRSDIDYTLSESDWDDIYEIAGKQSLIGVCLAGVDIITKDNRPPLKLICKWAGNVQKIRNLNTKTTYYSKLLCDAFEKSGFKCCILKGQSNIQYYPDHLKDARVVGDIDAWVIPSDDSDTHPIKRVIEFCNKTNKGKFVFYHNLDFPVFMEKGVLVEVHYRPTWMFAPWRNKKWNDFVKSKGKDWMLNSKDDSLGFNVVDVRFNIVFQLLHIYKHLFEEGIGLRQLLDYYFLMKYYMKHSTTEEQQSTLRIIDDVGARKCLGSVVYVLQKVFLIQNEESLCEADVKNGSFLLREIMLAGNFGHFDSRINRDGLQENSFAYAWMKLKRNMRFLTSYPEEVICEPMFRIYHWVWRTFRLWRYE